MLAKDLAPKTVRNVMTFLHSIFEHAIHKKWATENPVRHATRPKRRRQNDADPDLKYLTLEELDRVLEAIPDEVVQPEPAPTRRGRGGPAPPVPPDVWGPVRAGDRADCGDHRAAAVRVVGVAVAAC